MDVNQPNAACGILASLRKISDAPIRRMKTQVAIIGSGPAGLLLGHLLRAEGIDCLVLERQTRAHVEGRIRAGVLETVTTDLLHRLGIDRRLNAERLIEDGFNLAMDERVVRINVKALTGRHVSVYGQTELTRDLIEAAPGRGLEIVFEASEVAIRDVETDMPSVTYVKHGRTTIVDVQFVAGCDGSHGGARGVVGAKPSLERAYPFGWLGILADVPPCHPELLYAHTRQGFALASMRSPTRSRYYIQVPATERLEDWPEDRLWDELEHRFAPIAERPVVRGPALEMSVAPLRSHVNERMRRGRLFLAGDAAHVVPPTGAKGLNLAAADVSYLADALITFFRQGDESGLDAYQVKALKRVWKAQRFSWSLTRLMHRFPEADGFDLRMQAAEFEYLAGSRAMQTVLAENYAGLPL